MTDNVLLKFNKFKGIRTNTPVVSSSDGIMSAKSLNNIELKYSGKSDDIGIYSMLGRAKIGEIADKNIVNMWKHTENNQDYIVIYATDNSKGYLYTLTSNSYKLTLIYDKLTPSENANAISVSQGFSDYLFFTNGYDAPIAIQITGINVCTVINTTDYESRSIRGLGLTSYDGRVVMLCKNRVHWSRQGDIFDWQTTSGLLTDAAYQEFDRNLTALVYYNNSLIVFTDDYSVAFTGNPADTSNFTRTGATGGGASSYNAVLKIANKVFYYDHSARNLFSYYLYDTGQIRPSNGLADDIKNYFDMADPNKIDQIAIFPLVFDSKNEIWFKIPKSDGTTLLLILDYIKGEWIKRDFDNLKNAFVLNNKVISADNHKIYHEYLTDTYDNVFIPSEYEFNLINLNSNSSTKSITGSIYLTLDASYNNDFYMELTLDENSENTKIRHIKKRYKNNILIFSDDDEDISGGFLSDDDDDLSGNVLIDSTSFNSSEKIIFPLTFKQLGIRFFTQELGQNFAIKSIEFSKIKVKKAR